MKKNLIAFTQTSSLNDTHPICRFPARFQWILKKAHLNRDNFPYPECTAYKKFKSKVPIDDIQLVFASENVFSPSSMMGHTFLKLSGKTAHQRLAEHAITYFTVLDSINVPKIIYQNLFGGMRGIFALQPYKRIKNTYLKQENRNIWEYSLKFTFEQKNMIRAHIWELKNMNSDYLFGDYNCATITYFLLAIAYPKTFKVTPKWVSPLDVVKTIHRHHLVNATEVSTSDYWKIHMLKDQVNREFNPTLIAKTSQKSIPTFLKQQSPIEKIYTQTYIHYLCDHAPESCRKHQFIYDKSDALLTNEIKHYTLDYSDYKNPVKAPGAQHLRFSYGQYDHHNYIELTFFPAAIRLTDDQRQYFSTRELRMLEVNARIFNHRKIKIQNLTLYSVKSLTPWNSITKSLSGQWTLNGENHVDSLLQQHFVLNASAGLGYTAALSKDLSLSGIYNIGLASDFKQMYAYHFPEATLQINEIWNMKTIATFTMNFHMYNANMRNDVSQICQSYYYKINTTFLACKKQIKNRLLQRNEFQLSFEKNF